mmetsp:Transcript_9497/g.19674  ORF Transcript_9497/g.19674 Transcript_9497/m.19674 type:complete len:1026 (-) Transcript_9497:173-3250(-)|eukprot:CAMPEP_0197276130 /NCGR_PEP_ID=MMETSP1432-20130617/14810_1 /TAXON_ID=44447 /ORGANISM="Pseudo-nitzschia delicatissima, Strain UNC1205" /LENGTH=1025 /DNA_ID=CAMNT_0042742119 /DNA_START=163 /DNA_END=3240 /DNA_ORIENTATION=+
MSIRPISRKFFYTQEDWDTTYLPLCAVTTPLEELSNEGGDPIAAVPKCLYCGAPHPTSTTHFRFKNKILCYLCGETSSFLLSDQQELRDDEYLDPDLYDQTKFLSPKESREKKKADDDDFDEDFDFSTDTIEFRVPVSQNVYDEAKEGRRRFSQRDKAALATWQYPAMSCPPVWWIVVDGTVGNTTSVEATRNYWTTVGATLSKALEDIPPHVHVGLLTATGSRLASWDLTSAVPHCKQFLYSYDPGGEGSSGGKDGGLAPEIVSEPWDLCLVPANSHYKANLEGAIRGMVDGAMSGLFMEGDGGDGEEKKEDGDSSPKSRQLMPLGLTLEILLEFMEQATHPGQDDEEDDKDEGSHGMTKMRYAGGKILCLLGNPTLETGTPPSDDSLSYMGQPAFGLGGVAGACGTTDNISDNAQSFTRSKRNSKIKGKNGKKKKEETVGSDPSDLTPSNLKGYAMPLSPEDLFLQIGNRCAKAALGVDLIVLVPEEDDDNYGGQTIPWYGLPLLRPLSDASGAPGPLMFGTGNIGSVDEAESEYTEKFERLHENVLARTPWQSGLVFGVQMKFRLSPGLKLENSSPGKSKGSINPMQFLTVNGLAGPASLLTGDEEEEGGKKKNNEDDEDEKLFVMGSCDPHTSFLVDLETVDELADSCELEGYGSVGIKPVIQTCTLFTCIETDDAQPTPNYFTVCKMRVSSVALDFAADAESVFDGLDPEALAFILFNKVILDVYIDGSVVAQKSAESWMALVMTKLYASAKEENAKLGDEDDSDEDEFVAGDRLLGQDDGSMDETDVLLGEGHFKARFVALLMYAILQCDAVRPSGKDYRPSMDARLCAIAQLSSMPPKALARTLAPSLSLWCLKDDKAILNTLPLSKEGILDAIDELEEKSTENAVLVLESTQGLFLFTENALQAKKVSKSKYGSLSGSNFRETVDGALVGYRTFPPQWKAIEDLVQSHKYVDLNDLGVSMEELEPMLLEDKPSFAGDRDFAEWKERIGIAIKNEIGEGEDGKKKSRGRLSRLIFGGK